MSQKRSWNKVPGSIVIELGLNNDGELCDAERERELPVQGDELIINFTSSGSYDPGVLTGPLDGSYPPEYDEERLLKDAYILHGEPTIKMILPQDIAQQLFDLYEEEINKAELDEVDCEPEYAVE